MSERPLLTKPLEEGDRAMVDAAHLLPEGDHLARGEDGSVAHITKTGTGDQSTVLADIRRADGSTMSASAIITPEAEGISGHMAEWPAGEPSPAVVHVSGDKVQIGNNSGVDPAEAQGTKHEIAGKINEIREHIGEVGIKGA